MVVLYTFTHYLPLLYSLKSDELRIQNYISLKLFKFDSTAKKLRTLYKGLTHYTIKFPMLNCRTACIYEMDSMLGEVRKNRG